ncbi:thiamine-phosphate synthase family protein [uncultured Methanoregula sp.]|uniref:thiamine-phosphate synthase family protein n=1 Tax=uncultured Methanoregula sp. TaxID=1005933 RepID=UPI002AAB63E6|nr:thiamine-phosphate synthase family protein [uncultured Methanoregula sp.]
MNDPAQERTLVLETLKSAMEQLEKSLNAVLIPPGGISFGYAIRGARDSGGIAAISGRISLTPCKSSPSGGTCAFGAEEEIARIILTAMKFDPRMRSAASLAYSSRVKTVLCDDLFLESASCRSGAGPTTSTMDWGIASCSRKGVPDVIFRDEQDPAGSRTILFGEKPADVLNNIIMCSKRI